MVLNQSAEADTEVTLKELELALVKALNDFSPFGMGNPSPLLCTRNLKVIEVKDLKGAHLKAILSDGKRTLSGLMWRQTSHPALYPGAVVDIAYKIDKNTYNGFTDLQAHLQAVQEAK